jgi:hypothetical protein
MLLKTSERGPWRFSKVAVLPCQLCKREHSLETYLADLKLANVQLAVFQKLSLQLKNQLSKSKQGFELAHF